MNKAVGFEDYSTFVRQPGITVVKYYLPNCPPCRILKPTFEKVVNDNAIQAMEVCLNEFKKEQLPHILKAPSVEFFKDGVSKAVLVGKELCLAKLTATLNSL
jgi:thiol-disulfide isomerase/thioredoxin